MQRRRFLVELIQRTQVLVETVLSQPRMIHAPTVRITGTTEMEPAPISIMVVNDKKMSEELDPEVRRTAKNSLADQPVRTNSFYQAICAANQHELALEQRYCSRPDTRSSDEKALDSRIISNYLKCQAY